MRSSIYHRNIRRLKILRILILPIKDWRFKGLQSNRMVPQFNITLIEIKQTKLLIEWTKIMIMIWMVVNYGRRYLCKSEVLTSNVRCLKSNFCKAKLPLGMKIWTLWAFFNYPFYGPTGQHEDCSSDFKDCYHTLENDF